MADVAAPAQTQTLTPSLARERPEAHPCNARPDLYPAGGPPLGAGLIHENASDHLANFIRTCLREAGYARVAVSKDPLLHADRSEEPAPNGLLYTRPSILAYKALAAHRDPANAYHLGYDGPPDLVVEILSESTWKKDVGIGGEIVDKMRYYRSVGVVNTGSIIQNLCNSNKEFVSLRVTPCRATATYRLKAEVDVGRAPCWGRCGKGALGTARTAANPIC